MAPRLRGPFTSIDCKRLQPATSPCSEIVTHQAIGRHAFHTHRLTRTLLAYEGKRQAAPLVAALIIVPQLIVALLAPWVGQRAGEFGRKSAAARRVRRSTDPRGAVCLDHDPLALIVTQALDGITGAVLG